jgi:hypothetical protein
LIRKLVRTDFPLIRAKAETLAATMYPELISDIEKIHLLLREVLSSDHYYARAVGPEDEPKAALIARSHANMWAMKKSATILLWYSDIPGAGRLLLKDFKQWVKKDAQIVMAGITSDWHAERDVSPVLKRAGFLERGHGSYVYLPRGDLSGRTIR